MKPCFGGFAALFIVIIVVFFLIKKLPEFGEG